MLALIVPPRSVTLQPKFAHTPSPTFLRITQFTNSAGPCRPTTQTPVLKLPLIVQRLIVKSPRQSTPTPQSKMRQSSMANFAPPHTMIVSEAPVQFTIFTDPPLWICTHRGKFIDMKLTPSVCTFTVVTDSSKSARSR